ncbi:MAG: PAS domain-containing sensor histidine kinase [Alphaproteobacteria bacterium]
MSIRLIRLFRSKYRLSSLIAVSLSIAAIISGISTYIVLLGTSPDRNKSLFPLIYLNLFLLLSLAVVIAKRLVGLWLERKKGIAGSKLHIQLVGLLSFVSIVPAILVFVFSAFYLNGAVQAWFGKPVQAAIDEAHTVAEAYVKEHINSISQDAISMVLELRPDMPYYLNSPAEFTEVLTHQGEIHKLREVLVFKEQHEVINRSRLTFALEFDDTAELDKSFEKARRNGEPVVIRTGDRVRALVRLDPLTETYLYIGKTVDPSVLKHLTQTETAVSNYRALEQQRSGLQITFVLFFSLVALLLLLAAIWMGLTLANILMRPISKLISAAEQVSEGNLQVQIEQESTSHNEINTLTAAFNHMTAQLDHQRQDIITAHSTLESVLAEISAGVMGITREGKVNFSNRRASDLLAISPLIAKNTDINDIAPEIATLLEEVLLKPAIPLNKQITITRQGLVRILQVCVVAENGFVVTFDDVTPLLMAQKKAAWSDEARKIAHEIKNPLTPIQLSAERLKRRYLKEIKSDPETFNACIDTIVRQVQHIGNLVSEFSSFARMPEPVFEQENLNEICSQSMFLQREAHPEIQFTLVLPPKPVIWLCDQQQIGQVLTNLLQNAVNAILEKPQLDGEPGKIQLTLTDTEEVIKITIEDNGPGFPSQGREHLLEPYYTTRRKGTGLGLSIVAKIATDHRGQLILCDGATGGACVSLVFPRTVTK